MKIGSIAITTSKKVKKILAKYPYKSLTDNEKNDWHEIFQIYQSRIFGLCIHRTLANDIKREEKFKCGFY